MQFKAHFLNIIRILLLFVFAGLLLGCQSVFNPYQGKAVKVDNNIPLMEGGPHQGVWETSEVSFKYSFVRNSDKLELSGDLALYAASHWTYELIDNLFFRVSFIDSDGKLIDSRVIWSTVYGNYFYQWNLKQRTLDLPPNTAAMGFSYMGRVREAGSQGTELNLWHSPLG